MREPWLMIKNGYGGDVCIMIYRVDITMLRGAERETLRSSPRLTFAIIVPADV